MSCLQRPPIALMSLYLVLWRRFLPVHSYRKTVWKAFSSVLQVSLIHSCLLSLSIHAFQREEQLWPHFLKKLSAWLHQPGWPVDPTIKSHVGAFLLIRAHFRKNYTATFWCENWNNTVLPNTTAWWKLGVHSPKVNVVLFVRTEASYRCQRVAV